MPASIISAPVNQEGYIFLDVHGQLRVLHWRNSGRMSSPTDDVRQLLRHGVPFTWHVPIPSAPSRDVPSALAPPPPPTNWHNVGTSIETAHEQALIALFLQPGAHWFLAMGRLAWRLALQYGPPTLVAEALQGPSHYVRVLRRGDLMGTPEPVSGDRLYPGEEDLLIGRIPDGPSIWLPLSVFSSSSTWNGEWLPQNEAWFQCRHGMFSTPNMRTYTAAAWGRELRDQAGSRNRRTCTGIGSSEHGQTLLLQNVEALSFAIIRMSGPPPVQPPPTSTDTQDQPGS
ncbi:hypothetical protein EWM64_g6182 [Hericium alpestre]|uniref:Uncharacterized protein n=1 Tax=Hericium alpestre TaxID=135208 RepID=A0A4Y9ZUH4_9AGAM|nr:hypothetical protein EWM64_g6182 [Hericium alpestre]